MSDPNDTCSRCNQVFTDADEGPGACCSWCGVYFHAGCLARHGCPEQVRADSKALKAWEAGVRGWQS